MQMSASDQGVPRSLHATHRRASAPPSLIVPRRMFQDLLADLERCFAEPTLAPCEAGNHTHGPAEEGRGEGLDDGKGGETSGPTNSPKFHVTEYDVTRGQYPHSWEDYAGQCRMIRSVLDALQVLLLP